MNQLDIMDIYGTRLECKNCSCFMLYNILLFPVKIFLLIRFLNS